MSLTRARKSVMDSKKARALELVEDGESRGDIAERLGVPLKYITRWAKDVKVEE